MVSKPKGRASARETRSQLSQLDSHRHGTEKGVKWPMAVKDGSREHSGPSADSALKGFQESDLYQLQRALDKDKNLSGYGLKAAYANNRVEITGIVHTLEEKRHLKALLAEMGIDKFRDAVSISTDGRVLDDHVVLEVREELEADPELADIQISVDCCAGTVFLLGTVESRRQEELAVAAARKARGVVRVISHLNHLPGNMDVERTHSQTNDQGSRSPWPQ